MCAVRHPDKLRELAAASQPAILLPRSRRKPAAGSGAQNSAVLSTDERRLYPRLPLNLPLRLRRIAGQPLADGNGIHTKDLSSSGVRFEAAEPLELDTPVELEIELVKGPLGGRQLQMVTQARIVRVGRARRSGRWEFCAEFEDITYSRQEPAELASS